MKASFICFFQNHFPIFRRLETYRASAEKKNLPSSDCCYQQTGPALFCQNHPPSSFSPHQAIIATKQTWVIFFSADALLHHLALKNSFLKPKNFLLRYGLLYCKAKHVTKNIDEKTFPFSRKNQSHNGRKSHLSKLGILILSCHIFTLLNTG